jgi:hypothetical protein
LVCFLRLDFLPPECTIAEWGFPEWGFAGIPEWCFPEWDFAGIPEWCFSECVIS